MWKVSLALLAFVFFASGTELALGANNTPTNVGTSDVCYDEVLTMQSNQLAITPRQGPNFAACKRTPGDCTSAQKKQLAGYVIYPDQRRINRCKEGAHQINPASLAINPTAINSLNFQDGSGYNRMVDMYQSLGVPQEQAVDIVQNNTRGAYDLLSNIASGNTVAAQQIALDLDLDTGVVNNIGQIQQFDPPVDPAVSAARASSLPSRCNIEGLSGNIMLAESGCGNMNYNPKSSVSGPYHFLCDTWNTYANQCGGQYADDSSCSKGYRNDTSISTNVMNCMNTKFENKYGPACTAAGLTVSSCVYGIHVNGEPGFNKMFAAYTANPNAAATSLCGSAISNEACSNNFSNSQKAGSIGNLFASYDARLSGSNYVPPPTVSTPTYVPNATLVSGASGGGGGTNSIGQQMSQMMMMQMMMGFMQNSFNSTNQLQAQQRALQTQQAAQQAAVQPTLSLTVQPNVVTHGNSVNVSWTSTGMSTAAPCTVTQNGVAAGRNNSGAVTVPTTQPGSIVMRLMCQAASNGQLYQQSSSVVVQ